MSMNHGHPVKTETGWRFGASIGGQFYPLGYCRDCEGHATLQEAMQHYQQMLTDKQMMPAVQAVPSRSELLPVGSGFEYLGDALKASPRQADSALCMVCHQPFPIDPTISIGLQGGRCAACQEEVAAKADLAQANARLAKYRAMIDTLWVECIPEEFRNATLASFDTSTVTPNIRRGHAKAVKWAEGFDITRAAGSRSLIFLSVPGTGKTHLSAAVLRSVIERLIPSQEEIVQRIRYERALSLSSKGYDDTVGVQQFLRGAALPIDRYSARLAIAPELLNQLTEARFHREGQPSEEMLYSQLAATRLLILDDLGRVTRASQERDQPDIWYRVLGSRYNNRLPTIITTNKTMAELPAVVGDAVVDRMSERFEFVDMTGESYRPKKRAR